MSDLGVSADLKEPIKLDLSGGLGSALGSGGPTPGEIQKAKAESDVQQGKLRAAGDELVKSTEQSTASRHALQLQKPPMPPPQPAPEQRNTNPVEAWGSLAMSMAMLGSAFTRRPLVNSLNAAADVMKAYQAKDAAEYRTAFDKWKAESDYSLKLYEYQHESYKDAMDMIATDQKGALALFNAKAAALVDDPVKRLAEAQKLPELVSTLEMRQDAHKKAVIERDRTERKGQYEQAITEGQSALREATQSGDPNMIAVARQNLNEAIRESQEYHQAESTKAGPEPGSDNAILAQRYKEFKADPANAGREPTADQWQQWKGDLKKAESTRSELSPSKEIAVIDKDGHAVKRIAARESMTEAGKWVDSSTGAPVEIPPGGKIDVGPAANAAMIGSRESALLQRQLGAGIQASKAIATVVKLGTDASTGVMGGRGQEPGILNATKETLANHLTSQVVQFYNALMPGLSRSLAFIDSQGLQPGVKFTDSFNAEQLREGDLPLTKLMKLARQREIVEAGMETLLTNPRIAPEQREKAGEVMRSMEKSVPWTPSDVVALSQSNNRRATLRDFGVKATGRTDEAAAPASPAGGPPSGGEVIQNGWRYDATTHKPIGPAP